MKQLNLQGTAFGHSFNVVVKGDHPMASDGLKLSGHAGGHPANLTIKMDEATDALQVTGHLMGHAFHLAGQPSRVVPFEPGEDG